MQLERLVRKKVQNFKAMKKLFKNNEIACKIKNIRYNIAIKEESEEGSVSQMNRVQGVDKALLNVPTARGTVLIRLKGI